MITVLSYGIQINHCHYLGTFREPSNPLGAPPLILHTEVIILSPFLSLNSLHLYSVFF